MADPFRYFRVEASEIIEQLQRGLLDLEKGAAAADFVPRILRLAHTLKGAARVVKQREIADLAHSIEEALVPVRQSSTPLSSEAVSPLLGMVDSIRKLVGSLGEPAAPVESMPPPAPAPALEPSARSSLATNSPPESLRDEPVHVGRPSSDDLDSVADGIAELGLQLGLLKKTALDLARTRALAELVTDQLALRRGSVVTPAAIAKLRAITAELGTTLGRVEREVTAGLEHAGRELLEVRDAAERLRLGSVESLFDALERTARDAALSLGKRVSFETEGGDVRLESDVIVKVQRALVQAVRNAVAHGIEAPAERLLAGKAPEGHIRVEVTRRDRLAVFVCRDDGRGVDQAAVRQALAERGASAAELEGLDFEGLSQRLLRGGISTSGGVSEISGRGVGLDVVRETAEQLGGTVALRSLPGRGTSLELAVPASLSALAALIVEVGGQSIALPLSAVRRGARSRSAEVSRGTGGDAIVVDDQVVPFVPLAQLLHMETGEAEARAWSTILVESGEGLLALGVDRLLGTENLVARALPELMLADALVAGASLDADGNPRMLLSPAGLIEAARQFASIARPAARPRVPILVIDDSLTTRMLEQSILESAGYEVELATSGEEGIEKARLRKYALFLVDVEMPGMDGFTFIEQTQSDPNLRDVPAMLITSRVSADDLERGRRVGARGHIAKNEFDQKDLLDRIQRLVS